MRAYLKDLIVGDTKLPIPANKYFLVSYKFNLIEYTNQTKTMEVVNEMAEFVQTSKGREMLLYSGYQHHLKRRNKNGSKYWGCVNRNKCSGSLTTANNKIVYKNKQHTCIPDKTKMEVLKCLDKCKKRAREELIPIPMIFNEEFSELKDSGLVLVTKVPLFSTKKNTLYRNRHRATSFSSRRKIIEQDLKEDFNSNQSLWRKDQELGT